MASKAEASTKPGAASVAEFIGTVEDPIKRADSEKLIAIMSRLTGEPPVMWGGTMVGFGQYHYCYDSGHEGDTFLAGFSPRKAEFSLYLMGAYLPETSARFTALLDRLGKHRMGKACLYLKRLSDIDLGVLEQLITLSNEALKAHTASNKAAATVSGGHGL